MRFVKWEESRTREVRLEDASEGNSYRFLLAFVIVKLFLRSEEGGLQPGRIRPVGSACHTAKTHAPIDGNKLGVSTNPAVETQQRLRPEQASTRGGCMNAIDGPRTRRWRRGGTLRATA